MKYLPGPADWLFSAKTFAAAMLALYIGLATGLDRPYWALATVYIVSQPLSGALRSKAVYRLLGTLLGAAVCIVLIPNLANAPELLSLVLAVWTGLCLYISLLDRTPRGYVFMLGGYTAAIVGFPSVTAPDAIWDTALWRVEEIALGIACSAVIGSVVFPRPVGPVLIGRVRAWLDRAGAWADDALAGRPRADAARAGHARLSADLLDIGQLAEHLPFDTSDHPSAVRWVRALRRRMAPLLPILSSLADRMEALRAIDGITPDLRVLLCDVAGWRGDRTGGADPAPMRARAAALRGRIADAMAGEEARLTGESTLRISLLQRLRDLVDIEQDCRVLLWHIDTGRCRAEAPLAFRQPASPRVHRDHGMAALSAVAAGLTILLICAFWIATGWQAGAVAAEMAAVVCSFFAAQDNPVPAIRTFLYASVAALALDAVLLFAILPMTHDFATLAAALGLLLLPVGALIPLPALSLPAMALAANAATLLGLQATYSGDFAGFMDTGVAVVLGMAAAGATTAIVRSVGTEWSARRLLRGVWRDLAALADGRATTSAAVLTGLGLDRLGLATPRLAAAGQPDAAEGALADLRVGRNLLTLRRTRPMMTPAVRDAADAVLAGTSAHFAARARHGASLPAEPALLRAVDRAVDATLAGQDRRRRDIVLALVGLRRGLFAAAPIASPARPAAAVAGLYQEMAA